MTSNESTEAQRRFIDSLAKPYTMAQLESLLAPAFALNANKFDPSATLNQNTKRLTKTAASRCIEILKGL